MRRGDPHQVSKHLHGIATHSVLAMTARLYLWESWQGFSRDREGLFLRMKFGKLSTTKAAFIRTRLL